MFTSESSVVVQFGPLNGHPSYRVQGHLELHRRELPVEILKREGASGRFTPLDDVSIEELRPAVKAALIAAHRASCDAILESGIIDLP
jgi:hypothetical protein